MMSDESHAPQIGSEPTYAHFSGWQLAVLVAGTVLWPMELAITHVPVIWLTVTFLAAAAVAVFYDRRGAMDLRGVMHWDGRLAQPGWRWTVAIILVLFSPFVLYVYTWRVLRDSAWGERIFAWSRKTAGNDALAFAVLVFLLIPTGVGVGVIVTNPQASHTTLAVATATPHIQHGQAPATIITTHTTKATATSKPHAPTATASGGLTLATGGSARLGGTVDAFTAKWGAYEQKQNALTYNYNRQCGDPVGQAYCESVMVNQNSAGSYSVVLITISTPGNQPWSSGEAHDVCSAYVPSDAQYQKDVPEVQGNTTIGDDRIYRSASLAQHFPSDQFQDGSQNPVTPGTFDISYLYKTLGDGSQISDCQIAFGMTVG